MYDRSWLETVTAELEAGRQVVAAVVAAAKGHVPNRPGAKLAVLESGAVRGTVGGGALEFEVVESARRMLDGGPRWRCLTRVHDGSGGAASSGMICQGEETVALLRLQRDDGPVLAEVRRCERADGPAGFWHWRETGLRFEPHDFLPQIRHRFSSETGYVEYVGRYPLLCIIGAGHVALALTPLAVGLGFFVRVVDDRPQLPTLEANMWAHEKRVLSYDRILEVVPPGERTAAAVMTFGHRSDEQVLAQLLTIPLGYVGMMGSSPKREAIFTRLAGQGVVPQRLAAVHCPIGLAIGSRTPEEIAVSIAAELVLWRRGGGAPLGAPASAEAMAPKP